MAKIKRAAEADLMPMPPRMITQKNAKSETVRDRFGQVVMIPNPEFKIMQDQRKEFKETINASIRREYYTGLKPSIKRKIPDPPQDLDKLHALVRRIYTNELKHPDTEN